MRQLVEDKPCQFGFGIVDESVEQWIVEPSQRRIGRDAADMNVVTIPAQGLGVGFGVVLGEIAAVTDTACHRKAPLLRLDGERRGGEHRPYRVRTLDIGVVAVGAIGRQAEVGAGEIPN